VDLTHPDAPVTAALRTPITYEVLAPFSNILDALTLLTPAQYWATFALCGVCFFGLWIERRARSGSGFGVSSTIRAVLRFVGGTVAVVGIMLVASRPMASLVLRNRDLVAVDFHSHTEASHDGRAGFDAERNREWHASSGFNAAYVTDHSTFDGVLSGARRNPARAGDGTVLLPGVELRDGDEHPILIGVDPKRMRITSPDWKEAAVEADGGPVPPMLLLSMPGNILRIPLNETSGPVRIAGIEISDGCPRGIAQAARDGDAIRALAGMLRIATVSASDNHGWGRTAPAWSVLRIPGWGNLSPAALDIEIRRTIMTQGPRAITVIARRTVPAPSNRVEAALGGAMVALLMVRTMSLTDRLSWIGWSWGLCFLSLRNARRTRYGTRIRARKNAERKLIPVVDAAA
jgi:hypothetical protein